MPRFVPGRTWIGLLGPPNLPAAITARLHEEVVRILNSADVHQVLGENGLESIANTPAEFAAMIKEDAKLWDAAAADAGLLDQ
jgi:tripartite-type tricarboxylate transporter receptor subunit TctC